MGDVIPFPEVKTRVRCTCGWCPPVMRTYEINFDVVGIPGLDPVLRRDTLSFTIGYSCPVCGTMFTTKFGARAD